MKYDLKLMDAMLDSVLDAKNIYEALPALPEGMKPIYHRVLYMLHRYSIQEVRVSDLSNALGVQLPNMTKIINEMVEAGLVIKIRSTKDKRVIFIEMTKEGNDYFEKNVLVYRKRMQKEFEEFDEQDCYQFIEMIHAIQKKIYKVYSINGEE